MTHDAQSQPDGAPLICPDCDEEILGESDEERRSYYEYHLKTLTHQAGLLGEAGRDLMKKMAEERDKALRRLGLIP